MASIGNLQAVNRLNDGKFERYQKWLTYDGLLTVEKYRQLKLISNDKHETNWKALYTVGDRAFWNVSISISTVANIDAKVNTSISFRFGVTQFGYIDLVVEKDKDKPQIFLHRKFKTCRKKDNKTITASGYVIETQFYLYCSGSRIKGLIVLEETRKIGNNEKPCKITVANYITVCFENSDDFGLCVMATIQPSSKVGLDITVEGPDEHPHAILNNMFEEVIETGIWKHTTCLDFASRNNDMLRQQESEDNENSPPARVLDRILNRGIFNINNSGSVQGNYNGSNVFQGNLNVYNYNLFSRSIIRRYLS